MQIEGEQILSSSWWWSPVIARPSGSSWTSWQALMLRQVTCLPPSCTSMYARVNAKRDSGEIRGLLEGRACQRRWMQDFSRGTPITHLLTQRWRGWGFWGANASHNVQTHTHTRVCRWQSTICVHTSERACAQADGIQTVHVLSGCAPISRINERPLHFTVKQHGGLGGTTGCSL